jgi:hypothetical protein
MLTLVETLHDHLNSIMPAAKGNLIRAKALGHTQPRPPAHGSPGSSLGQLICREDHLTIVKATERGSCVPCNGSAHQQASGAFPVSCTSDLTLASAAKAPNPSPATALIDSKKAPPSPDRAERRGRPATRRAQAPRSQRETLDFEPPKRLKKLLDPIIRPI